MSRIVYGDNIRVANCFDTSEVMPVVEGNFSVTLPPWGVAAYRIYAENAASQTN